MPLEFILIYLNLKITVYYIWKRVYRLQEICDVNKPVLHFNNLSGLWKAIATSVQVSRSFSITRQEQTITEQAGKSRRSQRRWWASGGSRAEGGGRSSSASPQWGSGHWLTAPDRRQSNDSVETDAETCCLLQVWAAAAFLTVWFR